MYVKLYVLREENYISNDIENPVTGEDISMDYYVKLFVKDDMSKVDSCILKINNTNGNETCIANSKGKKGNCCE